jgi:NAD(P)H dehydrogenase (quinone)
MKVLIVLAHPEPNGKSFNHAMVEIAASALGEQGHEVRINDLYANGFNPVGGPWEFETLPDPDRFEYMAAQGHAEETGTKHADVVAEQEKLLWCDLLILQFPLWWFGMPGILKGWIDRVMTNGLAYENPGAYEKGGFRGRRATIATSTATEPEYYALRGRGGYMSHLLWPINNGVLRYVGFDVLPYFIADEVGAYAGDPRGLPRSRAGSGERRALFLPPPRGLRGGQDAPQARNRGPNRDAESRPAQEE